VWDAGSTTMPWLALELESRIFERHSPNTMHKLYDRNPTAPTNIGRAGSGKRRGSMFQNAGVQRLQAQGCGQRALVGLHLASNCASRKGLFSAVMVAT
jgi:hypothetical protein